MFPRTSSIAKLLQNSYLVSVASGLTHFIVPKGIWDAVQTLLQEVREEGERQMNEKEHGISIAQSSADRVSSVDEQEVILVPEASTDYEGRGSSEGEVGNTDGEVLRRFGANKSSETESGILEVHTGSSTPGAEQYWTENHMEQSVHSREVCTRGNSESGNDSSQMRLENDDCSGSPSINVSEANSLELFLEYHSEPSIRFDNSKLTAPYVPLRSRPLRQHPIAFDPAFSPRIIPQDSNLTYPLSPPQSVIDREMSSHHYRRFKSGTLPPPQFEFETYSEDFEPTTISNDQGSSSSLPSPCPLSPPSSPKSTSRALAMELPRASTSRHLEGSEISGSRKERRVNSGRSSRAAANSRKRDTLISTTPTQNSERGRSAIPSPILQHSTTPDMTPPTLSRQHLVHHVHHRRSNLLSSRRSHPHSSITSSSNPSSHASSTKPLSALSIPEEYDSDSSEYEYDERFVHFPSLRRPLLPANEEPYRTVGGRGSRNLFCGEQYRLFAIDRSKWNRTGQGYMTGPPGLFDLS